MSHYVPQMCYWPVVPFCITGLSLLLMAGDFLYRGGLGDTCARHVQQNWLAVRPCAIASITGPQQLNLQHGDDKAELAGLLGEVNEMQLPSLCPHACYYQDTGVLEQHPPGFESWLCHLLAVFLVLLQPLCACFFICKMMMVTPNP